MLRGRDVKASATHDNDGVDGRLASLLEEMTPEEQREWERGAEEFVVSKDFLLGHGGDLSVLRCPCTAWSSWRANPCAPRWIRGLTE